MSGDTKLIIGIVISTVVLLTGAVFFLRGSGDISEVISESQTVRQINIRDDGYNVKGLMNAEVILVEFSDFECPACKATAEILRQIVNQYGERVKLVYQHFPLSQHSQATPAALAAEAAGRQGMFWEMHDLIFRKQDELASDKYIEWAGELGLDVEQFKSDFENENLRQNVLRDLAEGNRMGITGTPTIYINGVKYEGDRSLLAMGSAIEFELKKTQEEKNLGAEGTPSAGMEESEETTRSVE
jgi:protein-disulfide isomerase